MRSWEVTIRVEGDEVLTIGMNDREQWVSGVESPEEFGDEIRTAAEHVRSFIGSGELSACFMCGGEDACYDECPLAERSPSDQPQAGKEGE